MATPSQRRSVASNFGAVVRPLQEFFRLEAASGVVLLVAALLALAWANSPWQPSYQALFGAPLAVAAAGAHASFDLRLLINDGLMTVFFFVVGMEIKRELVGGELRTLRRAALPLVAALGGMVVPSGMFLMFNAGGRGQAGWGIPMATDIAFAIGCVSLLGKRVPRSLVVFLTALAIFDDIGGILVIALFYGHGLHPTWLAAAAAVALALFAMNRAYVRNGVAYAAAGALLWFALGRGGIHATLAGVVLGAMIPARPRRRAHEVLAALELFARQRLAAGADEELDAASLLRAEEHVEQLEAPLNRFVHALHPWVAFAIMPLFALANSGVVLAGMGAGALTGPVAVGVAAGLALGKPIGILAASALAVRLRLAQAPEGASWAQLAGVGIVGGIGFTVALFIAGLAFPADAALLDQAKVGILGGSLLAGVAGLLALRFMPRV